MDKDNDTKGLKTFFSKLENAKLCALCLWAHLHICKLCCFNNEEEYIEFGLYSPLCHIMPRFAVWEENTINILLLNCNRVIHFFNSTILKD